MNRKGASKTISYFVYGAIALALLFILTTSIIMPQFNTTYNYPSCVANSTTWYNASRYAGTTTVCQVYNTSTLDQTVGLQACYGTDGATGENSSVCCRTCTNFSWRSSGQGLFVLVLVMALIGFAVAFIMKIRKM